ncbi:hypothetical protein Tco_0529517 [Tanacetum coccineum]
MWEEFTQSIHTFIEDKKNLAQHTQGKKKATLIMILSVRFTKLIVYYLQSKHKFHPRPGSPLHLPNEEPVLGYLKFSAKGTKREVFGMPIPNDLITDDIRGKQYYNAYLRKVASIKGYPCGEEVSDLNRTKPAPGHSSSRKETKPGYGGHLRRISCTDPKLVRWNGDDSGLIGKRQVEGTALRPGWTKPGDAAASQPPSSHVVHAGPNLEHMDLEASDTSIQPNPEQMDEEFTTTAYPNVQENLKLPTKGEGGEKLVDEVDTDVVTGLFKLSQGVRSETCQKLTKRDSSPACGNPNQFYLVRRRRKKDICFFENNHLGSPLILQPPPPPPAGSSRTPRAFKASGSSQFPPPPLPPSTNQSDQSTSPDASSSSKTAAPAEYTAWTTTDTRLRSSISSIPEELHMDDDTTPDEQWKPLTEDRPAILEPAWSIPSSDLPVPVNNWASALASTYAPPPENSLRAQTGDMAIFMDWFCKKQGITELKQQDLEGPAYEIVKVFHPNVIHLQYQMEECHKLLTDQVDESIIRYNVSKPLPLGGPSGHVMIQSDFFFNKDLEYLRYGRKSGRPALSISKMKAAYYPDVGLEQMTRNLVIRQRIEYFQLGIESYQTQLNLTKARWDATGFEYKHDFTVIDSPRAVTFRDKYGVQMIMQFNEIHKFSDSTLQQINEALDYRVKEFKVNKMNPGLNIRFWMKKDVDRSKEFMFSIQKRLKTRRIFRNLESFVGGRIREVDYRLLQRSE